MLTIQPLQNSVREYVWGSYTAIPDLLGVTSPSDVPWAELWMGAHEQAPSRILDHDCWRPLNEVIAEQPEAFLGRSVADRFAGRLPFLLKVLAAEKPLSIQAHPDRIQARQGFERENQAGIPLDAPNRNYKDASHKPEILCALTPFTALCGFRKIADIRSDWSNVYRGGEVQLARFLEESPEAAGLRQFLEALLRLPDQHARKIMAEVVNNASGMADENDVFGWIVCLNRHYPGDIGALSPIFLNLITLEPGQAIYLPAGVLHAYLGGTGVELMANSDNVLRGGLTAKHIDVPELLRVLDFHVQPPDILTPVPVNSWEQVYPTAAEEFVLSVITVSASQRPVSSERPGVVEIFFCTEGGAVIHEETVNGTEAVPLNQGKAVLIPATAGRYSLTGNAVIYKATVPC